jgi:histidine triad (HIT) family protein
MITHAPENYTCPFCAVIQGVEGAFPYSKQADIVYLDDQVLVMVSSHWWPGCEGNALVIPVLHVENIYQMPDELAALIAIWSRHVAIAMKETYGCDGISLRQHNEPAGNQDVWHFHQHVFPRYHTDQLNSSGVKNFMSDSELRKKYADRLREGLQNSRLPSITSNSLGEYRVKAENRGGGGQGRV